MKNKRETRDIIGAVSVGITWVDGRVLFTPDKRAKQSKAWYGVCHYSHGVFAITPYDYEYPKLVTQIDVSNLENSCNKSASCLHFKCPKNRFTMEAFLEEFKDIGRTSLGLPNDFGDKPLWFNEGQWAIFWKKIAMHPEGGKIEFSQSKWESINK